MLATNSGKMAFNAPHNYMEALFGRTEQSGQAAFTGA